MRISSFAKAATALLAAAGLAGCVDVDMEVSILGPDSARAQIETTMSSQFISMADLESGDADFCSDGGEITEDKDAETLTCVEIHEGGYADIIPKSDDGGPQPTIETVAPGRVKVTFPTSTLSDDMTAQMGDGEEMNTQMVAMMSQMFAGHAITMRVSGKKISDTNMVLSEDGKSAELVVPFEELFDGSFTSEEDAYAIVELD